MTTLSASLPAFMNADHYAPAISLHIAGPQMSLILCHDIVCVHNVIRCTRGAVPWCSGVLRGNAQLLLNGLIGFVSLRRQK